MSLSVWERQRDLLLLQKISIEKDLEESRRLEWECSMAERPDLSQRVQKLIVTIEGKIATQESLIDYAEMRINEQREPKAF